MSAFEVIRKVLTALWHFISFFATSLLFIAFVLVALCIIFPENAREAIEIIRGLF